MPEDTQMLMENIKPNPISNKRLNSTPADESFLKNQPPKKPRISNEANSASNKFSDNRNWRPARAVPGNVFTRQGLQSGSRFGSNAYVNDPLNHHNGQQRIQVAPGRDYSEVLCDVGMDYMMDTSHPSEKN